MPYTVEAKIGGKSVGKNISVGRQQIEFGAYNITLAETNYPDRVLPAIIGLSDRAKLHWFVSVVTVDGVQNVKLSNCRTTVLKNGGKREHLVNNGDSVIITLAPGVKSRFNAFDEIEVVSVKPTVGALYSALGFPKRIGKSFRELLLTDFDPQKK